MDFGCHNLHTDALAAPADHFSFDKSTVSFWIVSRVEHSIRSDVRGSALRALEHEASVELDLLLLVVLGNLHGRRG
jgi:hypothetical protein